MAMRLPRDSHSPAVRGPAGRYPSCWLVLALQLTFGWSAMAQEAGCREPQATVDVLGSVPPVEVDRTLSADEIRLREQRRGGPPVQGLRLGYYQATIASEYDAEVGGRRLSDGAICLSVKSLRVSFGFGQRKILIARALVDFPCIREHVMQHEGVHVLVDEDFLSSSFLPRLKTSLAKMLLSGISATGSDPNVAGARLKTTIDTMLANYRAEFARERAALQVQVDTADGGERLVVECGAELRRFLGTDR